MARRRPALVPAGVVLGLPAVVVLRPAAAEAATREYWIAAVRRMIGLPAR